MRRICVGAIILLSLAGEAVAQVRSPVQDLLSAARSALNDLRYPEADTITSTVLELAGLKRSERIQALQLSAGALFPEMENAQHSERATAALRQLIRIAPKAGLPREVLWPGLDSLYRQVRQSTFGFSATPRPINALTGPQEQALIEVATNRPAQVQLSLSSLGTERQIFLDSATVSDQSALRFRVLENRQIRIPSGKYHLLVRAIDAVNPDTIVLRFDATVEAPSLEFQEVPAQLDPSAILPEITRPRRTMGIIGGLMVAFGTVAASRLARDDAVKNAAPNDGRAVTLGLVLGIGTGAGVWALDKGAPIRANIAANGEARAAFAREVQDRRAENERRLTTYLATITINPEVVP